VVNVSWVQSMGSSGRSTLVPLNSQTTDYQPTGTGGYTVRPPWGRT
jgi:hypothetical protein